MGFVEEVILEFRKVIDEYLESHPLDVEEQEFGLDIDIIALETL